MKIISLIVMPLVIFLSGGILLLFGCKISKSQMDYSVVVMNTGTSAICIDDFMMGDSIESLVGFGIITPGGKAGYNTVIGTPHEKITIQWYGIKSDIKKRVEVPIRLPRQFCNNEFHSTIFFSVNPDNSTVIVTYSVFDSVLQDFIDVDSEGNRVQSKGKGGRE